MNIELTALSTEQQQIQVLGTRVLDDLLNRDESILFAAFSSVDGFEIAHRSRSLTCLPARLAAITSAVSSLGSAAASELQLDRLESVVIEANVGRIVLLQIARQHQTFIFSIVTSKDVLLGKVLHSARECAHSFNLAMGNSGVTQ